ncbi:Uma2 family endonuclease [Stratiformator vulcanicus]|uniref:Putative restriction endonuclease domain-containing protein n=1 Tax=Stratiformator vulcanicus TaxID=2527980 RepID=A0A517QZS8_9PLAN|nr:Uma2 family endonuclease [Stratiformator vulcanicus]QDT37149.1 hypothetical protein Pan189_15190 [Stratiformator vulcanicus]
MSTVIFHDPDVQIPLGAAESLENFTAWARSDHFPLRGRIDYIDGDIEIDMNAEELADHGGPKTHIAVEITLRTVELDLGEVYISDARLKSVPGNLSAEPDILVVTYESIRNGDVKLHPPSNNRPGKFTLVEGPVALVVEIVSDSSVFKDKEKLRTAYFEAGVAEYWLVDAREEALQFDLLTRDPESSQYVERQPDENGFLRSDVLDAAFRLERSLNPAGYNRYRLIRREDG